MDRCNPYSAEKVKEEAKDKANASKHDAIKDIKEEDEKKAAKDAGAK